MKKTLLLKTMLLLCALIFGTSAWGDTEDITSLGTKTWTNGSYTSNDVTITAVKGTGSNAPAINNTQLRVYSGNTVTISLAAGNITSIRFVATSSSYGVEHFTYNNTPISSTAVASYTWNAPSQMSSVTFGVNGTVRWTEVHVTYAVGPTINASSPVDYAADITSGEIPYTITNPTTGKSLTANSGDSWIKNILVGDEKVTFDMDENLGAARAGTITLSYEGATSKDITINQAAAIAKYTVTFETPTNGTLAILRGEDNVVSGSEIPIGTILTICATPDAGYKYKNWQYKRESGSWVTNKTTMTYTMTDEDVQFRANFDPIPQYTYSWMVNGTEVKSETLYEDDDVVFPPVADLGGKVFYGWVATSTVDPNEEPALVSTTGVKASENTTYYAVFATKTAGTYVETTDEITRATTGVAAGASSYSTWSGKKVTTDAVYAGNSAGGGSSTAGDAIQIRTKNSDSGIVSTTSGGNIKKVTVVWSDGNYTGTTLNVYASTSAYTDASDLYSGTATVLGTIVKGTSTEFTITGDYQYVGIRSNNNAICLDKVSFTWGGGTPDTYSDYCTSITVPVTIPANKEWITFCSTANLDFSEAIEGLKGAYTITAHESQAITLTATEMTGTVKAGTGLLLRAAEKKDVDQVITIPVAATGDEQTDNMLKGVIVDTEVQPTESTNTNLGLSNGEFHPYSEAGTLAAGKAYLQIPTAQMPTGGNNAKLIIVFDGETTGIANLNVNDIDNIDGIAPMYNLAGQRVNKSYKGVVIVNGKKVVRK